MTPLLYDAYYQNLSPTGKNIGAGAKAKLVDAVSCVVHKELNGEFELTMEYPVDGKYFSKIGDDDLIYAQTMPTIKDKGHPQPFRIYMVESPINGVVTIHARHMSYDLSFVPIAPFYHSTLAYTLAEIENVAQLNNLWAFVPSMISNTTNSIPYTLDHPCSVRECLAEVIKTYGLYISYDSAVGYDGRTLYFFDDLANYHPDAIARNFRLEYGKNMQDFRMERNLSGLATGIQAFYYKGSQLVTGSVIQLGTWYSGAFQKILTLDLTSEFSSKPTVAQLNAKCQDYIAANNPGQLQVSISVKYVDLIETDDYKGEFDDVQDAEFPRVGDPITVVFPDYSMNTTAYVVASDFDVLAGQYINLDVGSRMTNIADTIAGLSGATISTVGGGGGSVSSVTGVKGNAEPSYRSGNVNLTAADIGITVNDATLTIQKNGTDVGTFTANASSNSTVNISVPTATSDLNNDSGFLTSAVTTFNGQSGTVTYSAPVDSVNSQTGTVVLTASDVSALPDNTTYVESVNGQSGAVTLNIPTVNDATLTIQKNGTSVGTFTANASTATSINLTVPTKTSDLSNDSGFLTSAVTTFNGQSGAVTYSAPVDSVNGKTGTVVLDADDVGAIAANETGNTKKLYRPLNLNGLNDVTLDAKINTLRANRLAFLPADQIIIEKTTDKGVTWTDANVSDQIKVGLFSETRSAVAIPLKDGIKSLDCGLRVTFTAMKYNVPDGTPETDKYNYWNSNYVVSQERYTQLKEMYFWINANNDTISVKVERARGNDSTNWVTIFDEPDWGMTGWAGNDYLRFAASHFGGGVNQTTNFWNYRLTFFTLGKNGTTTLSTTYTSAQQSILEIRGYGDTWWGKSNEYMANDKLYTHDYLQNATFPAKVTVGAAPTASMDVTTKRYVDDKVPTKTSDLANDSGFLTSAVTTFNGQSGAVTYSAPVSSVNGSTGAVVLDADDVGALPDNTSYVSSFNGSSGAITYSAPVSSVNGQTGAVTLSIPTVNDATLTIAKNGTSVGTFTANASAAKTIDISVPTKTSDLSNDSGFLTSAVTTFNGQSGAVTYSAPVSSVNGQTGVVSLDASDVSALADNTTYVESVNGQSGAVTLSIPTVNDATLTIQKNGVNVETFTANASSNATANITVPTATSDLTNDSGFATTNYVDTQDASIQGTLFYGALDGTSTSTVMTATISGITEYRDGLAVFLKNGVVTSAAGFTININNLGAKPVYSNMAAATAESTIFNKNYTMLFVYDSTRVTGGCFVCYRGYYSDSNYFDRLRVANIQLVTGAASGRYSLGFIGKDGKFYGFARTSSTGTSKVLNTGVEFDPAYIFYQLTATYAAGASIATNALYDSYTAVDMRYSCNQGQFATAQKPVYLILHLESSGYFTLGSTIFTQTLPTTVDGLYYMPVGIAYSKYQMAFLPKCEILFYDGTKICRYAGSSSGGSVDSVNGQTGTVVLDADDVGALPSNTTYVSSFNGSSGAVTYSAPVTSVNGNTGAVSLTASDVGALADNTTYVSSFNGSSGAITYSAPVSSVNSKTGAVTLSASDVGALASNTTYVSSFNGNSGAITYSAPVASVNGHTGTVKTLVDGSAGAYTPQDVWDAIQAGDNVSIDATSYVYGTLHFTSFNYAEAFSTIISQTIMEYNGAVLDVALAGNLSDGTWSLNVTQLALKSSIPTKTSDLANDSGFVTSNTTYSLSINSNVITLTGSDSSTSTVTLPVYNGGYS